MAITQNDFDEIFARDSLPSEIAEWDDNLYFRGWGYLGLSTPPPMELFNKFFQDTDLKAQYLYQNKLDKSALVIIKNTEIDDMFK